MEKKLIDGYPNYVVYESGEIRNIKTGKRLEPQIKNGYAVFYPQVPNRPDGSRGKKMLSIHLVVAEAFLPKEEGTRFVVHIDGDKFNNRVSNLVRSANYSHQKNSVQVNSKPVIITSELLLVEEWVQISGVYNYEVSNTGFVRNATTHKILKFHHCQSGYCRVSAPYKTMIVHIKVAEHFLYPRAGRFIKHKDGNRENNAVTNLEWQSLCLRKPKKNKRTGHSLLSSEIVKAIKIRLMQGETTVALAKEFDLSQGHISNINVGRVWKDILVK